MRHRTCFVLACLLSARGLAADVVTEPYVWKSVTIGGNGFINGVVFGNAAGTPCYINTDMGGAYRLDGDTWTPLTDWVKHDDFSLNQNGIETLAVNPTDSNKVYFGLGTYMGPSAVLRSADRGRTLTRSDVDFGMNGNGPGRNAGQRLNVDPNRPDRLLYGTRDKGLYESNDAAATWTRVDAFPSTGDRTKALKDTGIVFTLFDAASGKPGAATPVAYAGVCTEGPGKIVRTTDAGRTWQPVPGQPGGRLLPTRAALTPDGKTLFATFVTARQYPGPWGTDGGAVYRCDGPAGASPVWADVTPVAGKWGWSGVCLDRQSPPSLYVTTLGRYASPGDDIYRSRDAGRSWSPLRIGAHRDDASAPYVKDAGIHWTGDVQVNPRDPDEAFFTTGYGLYRTTNLRADTPTWAFFNKGFEQSAVLALVSPPAGAAHLLSAIGDRDGYRHEDFSVSPKYGRFGQKNAFGQTQNLSMGTCNGLDIAYDKPDVCVRVGASAQYSNDGGITWRPFAGENARDGLAENGRAHGPAGGSVAVAPDAGSAVWLPDRHAALVSMNPDRAAFTGEAWRPVRGLPDGATQVVADLARPGVFYVTAAGGFYASYDGGRSFDRQSATPPAVGAWLRATPGAFGHLWATSGDNGQGGLYRSTDAGKTWSRVAAGALAVAKQVGLGAPAPGGTYPSVFVGGTYDGVRGFFRSDDAGRSWVRVNDDAHQYGNVTVITGDPRVFGRLYVGTNGRGIVYGDHQ